MPDNLLYGGAEFAQQPNNGTSQVPVDTLSGEPVLGPDATGLSVASLPQQPTTSFDPTLTGQGQTDPNAQVPQAPTPSATADALGSGAPPVIITSSALWQRAAQLSKLYPDLKKDPKTIVSLASLPITDDDLYGSVGQTMVASQAQIQAAVLSQLDAPDRWKRWQSLSKEAQAAIGQTGLPTPTAPNPGHKRGFWDQMWSNVTDTAMNRGAGGLGSTIGAVGGLVNDALSSGAHLVGTDIVRPAATAVGLGPAWRTVERGPGNIMQLPSHVYRALDIGNVGGMGVPYGDPSITNVTGLAKFDPSYISRAWEDTRQGKPMYRSDDLQKASNLVGNNKDLLDLASATAQTGGDVTLGVQKLMGPTPAQGPTPDYSNRAQALLSAAQGDPNFAKAVRQLQMGGVSFGRDGARDAGLKEGTTPYNATSGALDATYQWYANPLVAAGRATTAAKLLRGVNDGTIATAIDAARMPEESNATISAGSTFDRGYFGRLATTNVGGAGLDLGRFVPGTDAQAIADTAARRRYLVALADHINQHNPAGWLAARPQDAKAYGAFLDHYNTNLVPKGITTVTPNDILDWMDQAGGKGAVAKGQFASYLTPNDIQLPRLSRTGAVATMAKVAATPLGRIAPDLPLAASDVAPSQADLAKKGLLGTIANLPYQANELIRSGMHDGKIVLAGPEAVPSFARYVRQYLLPSNQRDQLINAFGDAANTAVRRDIVRQASEAGFRQWGLDSTEAGQNWINTTLQGMRENYSPAGRDMLPDGSHRDTLAPDLEEASAMQAPTISQLAKAGRDTNTLGVLRGGLTNPTLETMMHRYWAPFALLRLGFVPRIVSEEFLTALMRLQPHDVASGYAAMAEPWLNRIATRMDAYRDLPGANPVSKLGAIVAAHGFGLMDNLALRHLSPEQLMASEQMAEARGLFHENNQALAVVDKLHKQKAKLASSLSSNSPEVTAADEDLQGAIADQREVWDRMGRNQIVRQAYGKMFATGGSYLHSLGTSGDLLSVDGEYRPVTNVAMRGHFETVTKNDPVYRSAAAEYLGKFGRSPFLRSGLEAASGYGGDAGTITHLRAAFNGTTLADPDREQLVRNLRTAFHAAPPEVQDALVYYQRALRSGQGMQIDAAGKLRDLHVASDPKWKNRPEGAPTLTLAPEVRDLIDRTIGQGNYRPRVKMMPDEELGRVKDRQLRNTLADYRRTRSQNVKDRIALTLKQKYPERIYHTRPEHGGPLDSEHIAAMFPSPDREIYFNRMRGQTLATDAMVRHAHTPAFAQYIPSSGHLQYDLAEPVPKGRTRLYYPAASPSWQPGQINLSGIDNPQLRADVAATVLNRKRVSALVDGASENPTHQAIGLWAHPNPFRAERVAQHLAGDDAAVGYVDVPDVMRDAQRYENPEVRPAAGEPWHREAVEAKAVTERTAQRMAHLNGNLQGYRLDETQQADGHVLRDGHEVLPDGTWANGNSLEENIREMSGRASADLMDAFLANHRFLHGPAHDLLSQKPSESRFNANHLAGIPDTALPESVVAPVEMMLSRPNGPGAAWDRIVRKGFDKVVSPALESMVRSEVFALNLAKGLRAAKIVEPHLVDQALRDHGRGVADALGVHHSDLRYALDLAHDTKIRGGDMATEYPDEHALLEDAAKHDPDGKLADYAEMEGRVDDHLNQIATERAVTDTLPFINNHHTRSNMSEYMRNVSPFLWAQESFLKRWARALAYNPATFERLELGLHGLGAVGVVHKDAYGNDAITVPGSGALTHLLGSVGLPYTVAASVPFTMEVKNLTPGFARPATPAAGPLLTVPLAFLMGSQPEAATLAQAAGIPPSTHTAGANAFDQLVPAGWVRNLFGALLSKPDSQQWASARLEAMQMLAASGHAPTPGADAATLQTWQNQIANWTRNVYILRGALGFFTPATPTFDPTTVKTLDGGVGQLHADLQADIALFGVNEGVTKFMSAHPDAGAYTVFATSSAGGENVPATAAADQMMADHPGFFQNHPYAGAYFLPQAPGNFDRAAYSQQLSDGLRQRKGWDTLSREIVNAAASQTYYQMHDYYLQALQQTSGDSTVQAAVKQRWSAWSKQFQAANPLFTDQLNSSTGQATRGNVIDDIRNALASGDTPNPQAATQLGGMLQLYDYWTQAHQVLATNNTAGATDQRKALDAEFAQMAAQYVASNPLAAQFYNRTIVPEIAQQDQTLGRALEAVSA